MAIFGFGNKMDNIDNTSDELLSSALLKARRERYKPNISWLEDVIVNGEFQQKIENYIIIERYSTTLKDYGWLDTKVYRILNIFNDGTLDLYDPIKNCRASTNWKIGLEHGFKFKLPPAGRNPETLFESTGKRKTKKNFQQQSIKKEKKRGRGRPKNKQISQS